MDCPYFYPPYNAGGDVKQLQELADELTARGLHVEIVARQGIGETAPDGPGSSWQVQYVPPAGDFKGQGWRAIWPNLRFMIRIFAVLWRRRRSYDILLVSGFRTLALVTGTVARLSGKRCVVRIEAMSDLTDTVSTQSAERMNGLSLKLLAFAIRTARRVSFMLVDTLIAFSNSIKADLERLGAPTDKIQCVPNGIDTELFHPVEPEAKPAMRQRLGLPADRIIFVYTGRICYSKGVIDLLAAWERLVDRRELFLLMVGSGAASHDPCEETVQAFFKDHPNAGLMTGNVSNVADYLQASDVFIFLSHTETFSLSVLEAMATGLPSLVTKVGGASEVIHHHEWGSLVEPEAPPQTIVDEVEWLLTNRPAWPAMGEAARGIITGTCAKKVVVQQYIDLFNRL